jgi:hypothetical protein
MDEPGPDESSDPGQTGSTGFIADQSAIDAWRASSGTGGSLHVADGTAGATGSGSSTVVGDEIDLGLGDGDLTILLVFDKSGSMAQAWDDRGKWQIASDALMYGMQGVLDNLTVGAIFFPQPFDCQVVPLEDELQIQFTNGHNFVERWNATAAVEIPQGSTPLGLAFEMADRAIRQARDLGLLQQRFRVLVVTDGEPNCATNPESLVSYAASWRELGVETHVLGLPGSQTAADLLDRIALGGGTNVYVAPGDAEELEDTFYEAVR